MLEILSQAPLWVWPLLVYFIFSGITLSKPHFIFLPLTLVVPAIFTWLKLDLCPLRLYKNITIIVVCAFISWLCNRNVAVERQPGSLWARVEGTWMYLGVFLSIFASRFFFGFLKAAHPELYLQYGVLENFVTAAFTGVLWGRVIAIFSNAC